MKIIISFLLLFAITSILKCQSVDSIRVEKAGDSVKIRYKILNSNSYQLFRITIFATLKGGLKSDFRSLSGDIGENIIGGRDEYMVIWDVLKDVDEVTSAEFLIRAELTKDQTPKSMLKNQIVWSDKKLYSFLTFHEMRGILYGLRLAYMGNWGISGRYTAGEYHDHDMGDTPVFHSSLDITKRIINMNAVQIHFIAGLSYAKESAGAYGDTQYYENFFGVEFGGIMAIRRIAICIAESYFNPELSEPIELTDKKYFNFGIGIRF